MKKAIIGATALALSACATIQPEQAELEFKDIIYEHILFFAHISKKICYQDGMDMTECDEEINKHITQATSNTVNNCIDSPINECLNEQMRTQLAELTKWKAMQIILSSDPI